MATVTDFIIIKGKALEFFITIKEDGATVPLVLDITDTFTFSLVDKKYGTKYITDKSMTISDALNGEISGVITAIESATLPSKKANAEDYFIPRPNLRLVVHGDTLAQGEMTALIEDVYVVVG
ncbi:MAG: hypothetical protein WC179_07775 [Candidatus Cloacimonadaceae bacterium]